MSNERPDAARAARDSTLPIQLFASSPTDPRGRRAVDALRLALQALAVVGAGLLATIAADIDQNASDLLTSLPGFLHVVWVAGFWVAVGWSGALLVATLVRHRANVTVAAVSAAASAFGLAIVAGAVVASRASDVVHSVVHTGGPAVFPPGALAITSAVIATVSPYLTVPFRRFGRAAIVVQLIGSLCLGASMAFGALAAVALGVMSAAAVHLVWGSPAGVPTATRVTRALADLGVEVRDLAPVAIGHAGVAMLEGSDDDGPIQVKVYGRDALEGQFLVSAWRRVWFREAQHHAHFSRSEYVEHEGFMSSLAQRAGVRVPVVVTAGLADNGDAVIAVRPDGVALAPQSMALSPSQVGELWVDLGHLHSRGMVHQHLDLDRVVVRTDGSSGFGDVSSLSVQTTEFHRRADRSQLLALTVATTGAEAAVEQAIGALGSEGVGELLPSLQDAVLPPQVRSALRHQKVNLGHLRKDLATQVGAEDVELAKIRRVTAKSLLNLALLVVAAYTIIGLFSGIDFASFGSALADANWGWLAVALLVGQLARVANAFSTIGSSTTDLPLGPTAALNFATCYVNLAVPSSAGRIAISTRFFQRFGVPPAAALSAGVIDSISEFVVQVFLFLLLFTISDLDLGLSLDADQLSGLSSFALIAVGAGVVAIGVALLVPAIRTKLRLWVHQAHDALGVLHSPRKLAQLFGGNVMSQVCFALTLGACVRAFHLQVPLSSLILINVVVGLFAGLLPVPGGIGVSEAGLTLGLTRAGIPTDTALAIALTNRFCTFYLPPFWGYGCYRWMVGKKYL